MYGGAAAFGPEMHVDGVDGGGDRPGRWVCREERGDEGFAGVCECAVEGGDAARVGGEGAVREDADAGGAGFGGDGIWVDECESVGVVEVCGADVSTGLPAVKIIHRGNVDVRVAEAGEGKDCV